MGGLSPPPPSVVATVNGYDFVEVGWGTFPSEFIRNPQLKVQVLYRKRSTAPNSYKNLGYYSVNSRKALIEGLQPSATYDVLVGTVNNVTLLPGPYSKLIIVPGARIYRTKGKFLSAIYSFTGPYPNIFEDVGQYDALKRMQKFLPLYDTFCSENLREFICSAFLPPCVSSKEGLLKPCQSFCQGVHDRCFHAAKRLKLKWPAELDCENMPKTTPCFSK